MSKGTFNTFSSGSNSYGGSKPVWKAIWGKVEGGFLLDSSLIVKDALYPAGTLVEYDKDTGVATIPSTVVEGGNYGLIEDDVFIGDYVTNASVAVVYHGEVIEANIPDLIAGAKAELKMIHFV